MIEIEKLRHRLKNVNRNVSEYRMTVAEAKALLTEIDALQKPIVKEVVKEEPQIVRKVIMDGGSF